MRVRYASSQPAAICLAVSSSWAIASGTLVATRVEVERSAAASPSASRARPSGILERAQRKGSQSSASSPARRTEAGASAARRIGTGCSGGAPSRSGLTCSRSSGRREPSSSALTARSCGPQTIDRLLPGECRAGPRRVEGCLRRGRARSGRRTPVADSPRPWRSPPACDSRPGARSSRARCER